MRKNRSRYARTFVALGVLWTLAACGGGTDDEETDAQSGGGPPGTGSSGADGAGTGASGPGTPASASAFRAARSLVTLDTGSQELVPVVSRNDAGADVPFTVSSDGDCAIAAAVPGAVSIVARTGTCAETITVTSESGALTLLANVIDPMTMDIGDGLLIRYVDGYEWRWNDSGSGGDRDVTFWHPLTGGDGWFALGSHARPDYADINAELDTPMIVVKDVGSSNALAAPTDYAFVWNDAGSGADNDAAVWNPICPAGYVALGSVMTNGSRPGADAVRCVSDRYTAPGRVGDFVYNDAGTGADRDLSIYRIAVPNLPTSSTGDTRAPLPVGTDVACPGGDTSCDAGIINLLLAPLPSLERGDDTSEPMLTGYQPLSTGPKLTSSARVPFTLIPQMKDDVANSHRNVTVTPFYTLRRVETYASIGSVDNQQNGQPANVTYEVKETFSNTDTSTFTRSIGLSVTVGGGAKLFGTGGEWSATMDSQLAWENSTSSTFGGEVTNSIQYAAPPRTFVELVQVVTTFEAVDATGLVRGETISAGQNVIKYLQYPPAL